VNVNNEFVVSVPIEEAWKAMLDLERITVAAQGRDQFYVVLAITQRFTCKIGDFQSGRCWDRTSDLCRVKAKLARSLRFAALRFRYS
jgi:hypothetical protein